MSKLEIILIILKFCVYNTYFIVLLPKLERTYDQINNIDK